MRCSGSRPEHLARRHGEAMAAMARLRDDVAAARLDALIVVGDDQEELFHHDNMPAIGIYYGETIFGRLPYQKEIVESDYPCDAGAGAASDRGVAAGRFRSVGHALAGRRTARGACVFVCAPLLSAGRRADRAGVPQCVLSAEPAFAGTLRGARARRCGARSRRSRATRGSASWRPAGSATSSWTRRSTMR